MHRPNYGPSSTKPQGPLRDISQHRFSSVANPPLLSQEDRDSEEEDEEVDESEEVADNDESDVDNQSNEDDEDNEDDE